LISAATDVGFVMDLKHRSIGRSTRAPVADAIVDPDDFIAEIAPFGPVVMVHRHISESTHRGRIHFLYVVRADRCQCSASGGVSGHRAVEPMALQRASLRRWRYQFKEGRSDGKTRRRQFVNDVKDEKQGAAGITTAAPSVCDGPPKSAVVQKSDIASMSYKS